MNADNRELIEHTRKINKTLSMFVFALQEDADIAADSQLAIANLLQALAETIRGRAAQQAAIARSQPETSNLSTHAELPDQPPPTDPVPLTGEHWCQPGATESIACVRPMIHLAALHQGVEVCQETNSITGKEVGESGQFVRAIATE